MSETKLVYSTATGRINTTTTIENIPKTDGIIRIQRQINGRGGKSVCVVSGFNMTEGELKVLAAELKKKCGCGGSVKNYTIEIQGDKRELLQQLLQQKGYTVKLAGG